MSDQEIPDWISKESYMQLKEVASAQGEIQSQINEIKRKNTSHFVILGVAAVCLGVGGWQGLSSSIRASIDKQVPPAVRDKLNETEVANAAQVILKLKSKAETNLESIDLIRSSVGWTEVTKPPFDINSEYIFITDNQVFYVSRVTKSQLHFTWDSNKFVYVFIKGKSLTAEYRQHTETPQIVKTAYKIYKRPLGTPSLIDSD